MRSTRRGRKATWQQHHDHGGHLPGLVELKLAAGRLRDESDVVELILANPDEIDAIRQRLGAAHAQYVARFDELLTRRGNKRRAEQLCSPGELSRVSPELSICAR